MIQLVLTESTLLWLQVNEIWSPLQAVNVPLMDEGMEVKLLIESPPAWA